MCCQPCLHSSKNICVSVWITRVYIHTILYICCMRDICNSTYVCMTHAVSFVYTYVCINCTYTNLRLYACVFVFTCCIMALPFWACALIMYSVCIQLHSRYLWYACMQQWPYHLPRLYDVWTSASPAFQHHRWSVYSVVYYRIRC